MGGRKRGMRGIRKDEETKDGFGIGAVESTSGLQQTNLL